MKTVEVTIGQPGTVIVSPSTDSPMDVAAGRFNLLLPEVVLPVTSNGQTRFNVGGLELRRNLYLNGVRQRVGVDFTITLPYINWISGVPLETSDLIVLTF